MNEKTILLVEDNENDAFLTRRALTKSNIPHRLVIARDGVEALDYLHGQGQNNCQVSLDIILLDLKLPRIDGLQVLKEIRSNEKTRYLPVMILTSSSEEIDINVTNKLGATSYTVKPTDSHEYAETVQNLILGCMG